MLILHGRHRAAEGHGHMPIRLPSNRNDIVERAFVGGKERDR